MLKSDLEISSTSEDVSSIASGDKKETSKTDKQLISQASRTAQILLQDEGIKMTQSLRRKIIDYQSDLGSKILLRQSQGFLKLSRAMSTQDKRRSFEHIRTSWLEVELRGEEAAEIANRTTKRAFLHRWVETLKLKKHLMNLTLKAFEFRKQSQKLQMKLILCNMRRVLS